MDKQQMKYRRQFTYAMLFYVVGFAICFTVTSVLLKDLSAAFHLPETLEGTMSSICSIGSLLALVSMLFLQGRIRKSSLLAACGLVMVFCMVFKSIVPSYGLLLVIFFVFGIALGFGDCSCNAFIVDLNGAGSSKYLGALHAFSGLGAMVTPLFITWVRSWNTWQVSYRLMALVAAIPFCWFLFMCFYMKKRIVTQETEDVRLSVQDVKNYLTRKENLGVMAAMMFYNMFFNGFIVWVTLYASRVLDAGSLSAYPLAVFWIFGATSRFFAPRTGISNRKLFLIGTPLGGVILLIGVLLRSPMGLIICCGLCGLVTAPGIPTLVSIACEGYEDRSGLPSSLLVITQYIGSTISPMAMAAISAAASLQESMIFTACCAFVSTAFGLLLVKKNRN